MSVETEVVQLDLSKMTLEDVENHIHVYNRLNQKLQHLFDNLQDLLRADSGLDTDIDPELGEMLKDMKKHGFNLKEKSVEIFTHRIVKLTQRIEATRIILSRIVIMHYLKKLTMPGLKYELEEINCPNHYDDDTHNHTRIKVFANKKNAIIEDYMNRADWI